MFPRHTACLPFADILTQPLQFTNPRVASRIQKSTSAPCSECVDGDGHRSSGVPLSECSGLGVGAAFMSRGAGGEAASMSSAAAALRAALSGAAQSADSGPTRTTLVKRAASSLSPGFSTFALPNMSPAHPDSMCDKPSRGLTKIGMDRCTSQNHAHPTSPNLRFVLPVQILKAPNKSENGILKQRAPLIRHILKRSDPPTTDHNLLCAKR